MERYTLVENDKFVILQRDNEKNERKEETSEIVRVEQQSEARTIPKETNESSEIVRVEKHSLKGCLFSVAIALLIGFGAGRIVR